MAEEINYASVVFKNKTNSRPEAQKGEEIVYDEVKVPQKKAEQAADDQKATNKHCNYQLMACCLGIFCIILLSGTIVSVYFTSVIYENNNKLTTENQQLENLAKECNVSEMKIKKLTAENQQLNTTNQQLETQNQQLETLKNNLTEQIRNIENCVTVTQQICDAYCPIKDGNRQCKPCLDGWEHHQSSCYVINDPDTAGQKTWEEAQQNCRGKNSDLAVIVNEDEKKFISDNSWYKIGLAGYWIGLRAEAGKWKWINGSDLAEKSWMTETANNGNCAISVQNQGWKSVTCVNKNRWICKKAALSV